MRDDVTESAALELLRRLCSAFGKPFGAQASRQGEEYSRAFRRCGIPLVAVTAAVDQTIALGKRFPPVSELIERAREFIPQTDAQRNQRGEGCPHCGSHHFYAGYEFPDYAARGIAKDARQAIVLPKVRCACPQSDEGWWTPDATAWTETDPLCHDRLMPRDYLDNPRYRTRPERIPQREDKGFQRVM